MANQPRLILSGTFPIQAGLFEIQEIQQAHARALLSTAADMGTLFILWESLPLMVIRLLPDTWLDSTARPDCGSDLTITATTTLLIWTDTRFYLVTRQQETQPYLVG